MDVPVQYFQSVIALATAITGALLFQIRFFAPSKDAPEESGVDPRLRVLLLLVLTATVFGSLEAIREHRGRWSAVLVTVGLAVSLLPILLRVLPPLQRDARTQQRDPHYWMTVLGLLLYAVIVLLVVATLEPEPQERQSVNHASHGPRMFRFRPSSMDTRCLLNWTFDRLAVDTFRRRSVLDLG